MPESQLLLSRRRRGHGFEYFYPSGRKIGNKKLLRRIQRLVIPPNWQHVKINVSASAPLQATGIDVKGRKQYIYHPHWHKQRQEEKFAKLVEFGEKLPAFRKLCWEKAHLVNWSSEKSLALVCLLLDHTGLRAGNRQYTRLNETYGITTLRRKHFLHEEGHVRLRFVGKHRRSREVEIEDPELAELVAQSAEQRGYALFRYQNEEGQWLDVESDDVNHFIHTHMSKQFSCKDFRTWAASRFALFSLPVIEQLILENPRRKWSTTLTRHVAQMLGNTVSVCRQYYLHPKLYEIIESVEKRNKVIQQVHKAVPQNRMDDAALTATESLLREVISS